MSAIYTSANLQALREITRRYLAQEALRAALQPHPWFWYYMKEARDERDLQRWADDGGCL